MKRLTIMLCIAFTLSPQIHAGPGLPMSSSSAKCLGSFVIERVDVESKTIWLK